MRSVMLAMLWTDSLGPEQPEGIWTYFQKNYQYRSNQRMKAQPGTCKGKGYVEPRGRCDDVSVGGGCPSMGGNGGEVLSN